MIVINLNSGVPKFVKSGKIEFELAGHIVRVGNKVVKLTEAEYEIALMSARSIFIVKIWGDGCDENFSRR